MSCIYTMVYWLVSSQPVSSSSLLPEHLISEVCSTATPPKSRQVYFIWTSCTVTGSSYSVWRRQMIESISRLWFFFIRPAESLQAKKQIVTLKAELIHLLASSSQIVVRPLPRSIQIDFLALITTTTTTAISKMHWSSGHLRSQLPIVANSSSSDSGENVPLQWVLLMVAIIAVVFSSC